MVTVEAVVVVFLLQFTEWAAAVVTGATEHLHLEVVPGGLGEVVLTLLLQQAWRGGQMISTLQYHNAISQCSIIMQYHFLG